MGYEVEFLSVGSGDCSGDAILLRFGDLTANPPKQTVVVIDGGYADNGQVVVDHITKHYKTDRVNLAINTHPDSDHANGLAVVLEKMTVDKLWMHQPWNHTQRIGKLFNDDKITDETVSNKLKKSLEAAKTLESIANRKGILIVEPFTGVKDATGQLVVCGPTQDYYESLLPQFDCLGHWELLKSLAEAIKAPIRLAKDVYYSVTESWDQDGIHDDPKPVSPQNNASTIILFACDGRYFLFTGDAGIPALTGAADWLTAQGYDFNKLTMVQVPHHGSRRNVGPTILDRILGPKLPQPYDDSQRKRTAFVSAAKDGGPKHPSRRVKNAFRRRGAPVTWNTDGVTTTFGYLNPDRGWVTLNAQPFFTQVEQVDEEKKSSAA